jgi:hypothetical protein
MILMDHLSHSQSGKKTSYSSWLVIRVQRDIKHVANYEKNDLECTPVPENIL